jgi:diadenosine tetraphosphate (Ap4A) HIT family hydrolase
MHPTLAKFNYPRTLVVEDDHWAVLVRTAQPTLGALVLAARRDVTSLAALTPVEAAALPAMAARIERMLATVVAPDKLNYLALMMVDPQVHFHVLPRYAGTRQWRDVVLADAGWPGVPQLQPAMSLSDDQSAALVADLRAADSDTTEPAP